MVTWWASKNLTRVFKYYRVSRNAAVTGNMTSNWDLLCTCVLCVAVRRQNNEALLIWSFRNSSPLYAQQARQMHLNISPFFEEAVINMVAPSQNNVKREEIRFFARAAKRVLLNSHCSIRKQ
ncbi:hypothetical protein CEXT_738901 [Caerostris extrusa]|uniref:Uncharacterized protein n=1 Tax=Caerostris extrusa TaxID=172846 RepID=A0AAV4PWJ4_CAEEX|nr:hypothetical protein CEXT_738901 [Caerostris extrusa]